MGSPENFNQIHFAVGQTIRRLRKEKGLKQYELAEAVGIGRATLVNIEMGRNATTLTNLYAIAAALSVTVHELLPVNKKPRIRIERPRYRIVKIKPKYKL